MKWPRINNLTEIRYEKIYIYWLLPSHIMLSLSLWQRRQKSFISTLFYKKKNIWDLNFLINSIRTKIDHHSFSPGRIPYNVSQMGDENRENHQIISNGRIKFSKRSANELVDNWLEELEILARGWEFNKCSTESSANLLSNWHLARKLVTTRMRELVSWKH